MITAITAFVPIPGHPRSLEEYLRLGDRLLSLDIPIMATKNEIADCWMFQYLKHRSKEFTHSVSDNPVKNTAAYHMVQAQKSEWLADAAWAHQEVDVLVWIDFGIFHVPGITGQIIKDFLHRAEDEQAVAIPGCWDKDYIYDDAHPCWRFCGGVMVVPRQHVFAFDKAMKQIYVDWIELTGNLSWEVNTLARLERSVSDAPIWWYKADHDASLFTNYKAVEYADGGPCS